MLSSDLASLNDKKQLIIDPEFKALIPALTANEHNELEKSLNAEGCRDALVVWQGHSILIDGHNRYTLCSQYDIPYQTIERAFDSREDVIVWIISNQLARRNIPDFVRVELSGYMEVIYAKQAEARMLAGVKTDPVLNLAQGRTRDRIAVDAGVASETVRKVKRVVNKAPTKVIESARSGSISTNRAFNITEALEKSPDEYKDRIFELSSDEPEKITILNRLYKSQGSPETNGTFEEVVRTGGFAYGDEMEKKCIYADASITDINKALASVARNHGIIAVQGKAKDAQSLPEGVFNVIYADPPWQYDNAIPGSGAASNHYPTMPLDKICSFLRDNPFDISINAVLFMWVTNPFLQDAFKVLDAWGFNYKTNMCWVKTEHKEKGSGFYVRGRHELLFIATRGSFTPLDKHIAPPIGSVINAPLQEHSQKPDDFYAVIERLYPQCNYLELFARREREGWSNYGNELS